MSKTPSSFANGTTDGGGADVGCSGAKESERRTEGERDSSSGRAACARRVRACVLQRVGVCSRVRECVCVCERCVCGRT